MASIKAPPARAYVAFSTRLATDVAIALDLQSSKTGTPKTKLVDKALRKYLKLV